MHIFHMLNFNLYSINRIYLTLGIVLSVYITTIQDIQAQKQLKIFNSRDGLPQNTVDNLIFNEEGGLYVSTQQGIVYFDGHSIKSVDLKHFDQRENTIFLIGSDIFIQNNEDLNYLMSKDKILKGIPSKYKKSQYVYWPDYSHLNHFRYNFTTSTDEHGKHKISPLRSYPKVFNYPYSFIKNQKLFEISPNSIHIYDNQFKKRSFPFRKDKNIDLKKIIKNGFIFFTKDQAFVLVDHSIYEINIINNQVHFTIHTKNVPIDKTKHLIISGTYSRKKNSFVFGTQNSGFILVNPSLFDNVQLDPPNNVKNIQYSQLFINNHIITTNGISYDIVNHQITDRLPYFKDFDLCPILNNEQSQTFTDVFNILHNTNKIAPIQGKAYCHFFQNDSLTILTFNEIFAVFNQKKQLKEKHIVCKEKLPSVIEQVYLDKTHILLSTRQGMFSYNPTSNVITKTSLPEKYYRGIFKSPSGLEFVTTYGDGIYIKKDQQLVPLDVKFAKNLTHAHYIIFDHMSNMWIPTNNGLYRILESEVQKFLQHKIPYIPSFYYDTTYGLPTNEFNGGPQNCGIKFPNGISLSTMQGITIFNPSTLILDFPSSPFTIDKLLTNTNQELPINDTIHLSPNIHSIQLSLSCPYYGPIENFQLEYKTSTDSVWRDISSDRKLYYFNPEMVGYDEITIRLRSGLKFDDFYQKSITILIMPKWFQTWWFRLLLLSSVILMGFIIVFVSKYFIKKKNEHLQKLVDEQHNQLIESNRKLQLSVHFNKTINSALVHDFKSPLNQSVTLLNDVLSLWLSLTDIQKRNYASIVLKTLQRINDFLKDYLNITSFNANQNLMSGVVFLHEVIEKVKLLYEKDPNILDGKIILTNNVPKDFTFNGNYTLIKIIIANLTENAIKYANHGEITYSSEVASEFIKIKVRDNGNGMTPQKISEIKNLFYSDASDDNNSHRLGFLLISQSLKILGGHFEIYSDGQSFTEIQIDMPIH